MTNEQKALENLQTIRQILEKSTMNPEYEDIVKIYLLTEVANEDN